MGGDVKDAHNPQNYNTFVRVNTRRYNYDLRLLIYANAKEDEANFSRVGN